MRLHLNENTAGCSPAVLRRAARARPLRRRRSIPTTTPRAQAVAGYLGVPADHVLLTNGLDEGILAAAAAACRDRSWASPRRSA